MLLLLESRLVSTLLKFCSVEVLKVWISRVLMKLFGIGRVRNGSLLCEKERGIGLETPGRTCK
jgi:hypothetical protein